MTATGTAAATVAAASTASDRIDDRRDAASLRLDDSENPDDENRSRLERLRARWGDGE